MALPLQTQQTAGYIQKSRDFHLPAQIKIKKNEMLESRYSHKNKHYFASSITPVM